MQRYSGPFFTVDGFIQAEIILKDGQIVEFEEGGDSGMESIIIPSFYNSHTHMNDAVVKDIPEGSISEVVGPGGIKNKAIQSADNTKIAEAIKRYLYEAIRNGISHIYEFREGGIRGLKTLNLALKDFDEDIQIHVYSRPFEKRFDEEELINIISSSEGLGLSAYRDWEEEEIKKIASFLRNKNVPLALHCSEDVREPIKDVISLGVDYLVHMIEANQEDLEMCAEEDIPIVICPRSNLYFRKRPRIPLMLKEGLDLLLGTDNAMFCNSDMFREMEFAYRLARLDGEVSAEDILMMATWNPRKVLNHTSNIGANISQGDIYLVLETGDRKPAYEVVTRKSPKDIVKVVKWKNTIRY
ncbi:MAG: amidohydrolase family protein [Thermoplasmatota archaeon]